MQNELKIKRINVDFVVMFLVTLFTYYSFGFLYFLFDYESDERDFIFDIELAEFGSFFGLGFFNSIIFSLILRAILSILNVMIKHIPIVLYVSEEEVK